MGHYVYAFKGDRLYAAMLTSYHEAGGTVASLRKRGWQVFHRFVA